MFQTLLLAVLALVASSHQTDPVIDQLPIFKNSTTGSIGTLTTSSGAPVASIFTGSTLNTNLNTNPYFMDTLTHFVREKIPERIVHMKGAGAFGYFETKHDISDICKAEFLNEVGKQTPVVVRFSVGVTGKGGPDTTATPMGFGVRFYTQEGNFDLLGLNFPLFVLKDPAVFPNFIHVMRQNPTTRVADPNMLWDFASRHPESLHMFLRLFGNRGIPYSYSTMPCYPIETFQVYNANGTSHWVRFNMIPEAGIKYMNATVAASTACSNLDYYATNLYTDIANGNYPAWNVSVQVLTEEDVKNATFDVFDTTKCLPESTYPSQPIGRMVLNKNPENDFVQIEQLALSPSNLVPGVRGSSSKVYEARSMFYRQAQAHRLGSNYNNIPVNCPYRTQVLTYNRDGAAPAGNNGGDSPNYYPNNFNGSEPYVDDNIPSLLEIYQDEPDNFDQANDYYQTMPSDEVTTFVDTIITTLCYATDDIQARVVEGFNKINTELGDLVAEALETNSC